MSANLSSKDVRRIAAKLCPPKTMKNNLYKLTIASLLAATLTVGASDTSTLTLAWDHDGVNVGGFRLYARQATNASFVPIMSIGPTNRTAIVTITNPPPMVEFTITATNAYGESPQHAPVRVSKPATPGTLRVVAVVTVQVP